MDLVNWTRITLCGLIVGAVFTLLNAVLVGTLGSEFVAAAGAHASLGDGVAKTGPSLFLATVFCGLWAMWLYSIVRSRITSRMGAVLTVSLAWWVIAGLQSLKWILLLGIPLSVCLPLTANLVTTVIAVYVGSVLFGDGQPAQRINHPAPAGSDTPR